MSAPTLKECLSAMARLTANGMGFKPKDAPWMLKMNEHRSADNWTARQKYLVWDILSKYVTQLRSCGIDFFQIPIPQNPAEAVKAPAAVHPVIEKVRAEVKAQAAARTCELAFRHKFILRFQGDEQLDNEIKKTIPYQYRHRSQARDLWEVNLAKCEGWVVVDFRNFLRNQRFSHSHDVTLDIEDLLKAAREVEEARNEAHKKSFAIDAELVIDGFDASKLRGFQKAGVRYAIEKKRTFIADEMGLGKSIQALAIIEHEKAYPALIVVKAALRDNWINEIRKWIPSRFSTLNPDDMRYEITNILVISYEGLVKHYDKLEEYDWKSITLDESQMIKTAKSKRARACRDIAKVSKAPVRLCLTGTPIDNAPYEFLPQIQFLGLMEAIGGNEYFYDRYCNRDSRGARNLLELNTRLRKVGYIRREKKDVLTELPDKQRSIQVLEIDNMEEYRRAEKHFIDWLKGHVASNPDAFSADDGDESLEAKTNLAVGKARNAEQIVQVNHLKRLAMQGMLENAKAWIEDFIESGQKLIVFCHHIEAQDQVYRLFKDVAVWTRSSAGPQAAVHAFQNDPRVKIIVCSLQADNAGHTLTAASNVVFLELGWTPTIHDQATDRAHRIGQKDSVTAWYLVAKGTIYERIINLIEAKRAVVQAATSGREVTKQESVISQLLKQMAA